VLLENVLVIPMGTNCVLDLPNFHLFSYEFEFLKCLFLKNKTCLVVLHRLSLVCRFVDDLFVLDFQTLRILCT
jgi:hypothetical protein